MQIGKYSLGAAVRLLQRGAQLGLLVLSTGCASAGPTATAPPLLEETAAAPAPPAPPARPFESDTLYALLVAEFAGERQRLDVMLNNYIQQARTTGDLAVTARAARVARFLEARPQALEMALAWSVLAPQDLEARYSAAAELVAANRLQEAVPHAEALLRGDETAGFDAIGAQALQGGDINVTEALLVEFERLLKEFPKQSSLHLGQSFLAQHKGDLTLALSAARRAQQLDESSFQAAGQEIRVLEQMGRLDQALDKLAQLVEQYPDNNRLKLQYARSLLRTDLAASQGQFEDLLVKNPGDHDLVLTLALVRFERGLFDEAAASFSELRDNLEHRDTAHYYLGRIASQRGEIADALALFAEVGPGNEFLPAMSQRVDLLLGAEQRSQALRLVRETRDATPVEAGATREGLSLIEAHILSTSGSYQEAIAALDAAAHEQPQSNRVLYTRAMLYTQLDKLDAAERDFRTVLAREPNNAAALNALGYTLAGRSDRLDEAYGYISRAYGLTPDDPAVMDSMGWVEYLRGNHEVALDKLTRAMAAMPDHEIAAHLGEVLWVTGKRERARATWREGLALKPDSPVINETLKRLNVKLD